MRRQETRKGKKAKRVRNRIHKRSSYKSHKSHKSHRRKSHKSHRRKSHKSHRHKSHRQQGGDYVKDFTGSSIDGMPYTKEAVVVAGQDIMKAKDLQEHADYLDRQGLRT